MELIIDRVSKQYKNKIAVDRISVKLQKGVYGLLGANGAGKTTLMRMICPVCKSKTRIKIRLDTVLENFPLFCPKCKQETLISVKNYIH